MSKNRNQIDRELKHAFISEAHHQIGALRDLLSQLRKNLNDSQAVAELFRRIHTLKGGALSLRVDTIYELCHDSEGVLEVIRNGTLGLGPSILNLLNRVVLLMDDTLEELEFGHEIIDRQRLQRLRRALYRVKTEAVSSGSGSLTEPTKESLEPVVGVAFFPENLKRQFEDHLNLKAAKSPFPDSTAPIELDLGEYHHTPQESTQLSILEHHINVSLLDLDEVLAISSSLERRFHPAGRALPTRVESR